MSKSHHLLVLRFSSLGDVAMTVPVLKLLLQQHQSLRVTVVSNGFTKPLFEGIERLDFHEAKLKGIHQGFFGLYRLYKELLILQNYDAVADLHNVLRTKVLQFLFKLSLKPVVAINKGRKEKKELTRPKNKKVRKLKTTFERYADVFKDLGYPLQLNVDEGIVKRKGKNASIETLKSEGYKVIGIAPFAHYSEKVYPIDKMNEVLKLLSKHKRMQILLFGSKEEAVILQKWQRAFENVSSCAGRMSFEEELVCISNLDLMVSMDSANMHLASIYGVPVISIWGGTHPYLGFYGWGQSLDNAIQIDIDCRPSSVFGNKPCPRGDFACMNLISPIVIYEKVIQELNLYQ